MKRLFGTDGVRGIANEFLTCELATSIGKALGKTLIGSGTNQKTKIIIGADTRLSSDMLVSAICAGLCSVGCDCYMLGVVPTPAVAYLVKECDAKAGVMISASHNPYNYNGIKIFNKDGFKLSDELEEYIEDLVASDDIKNVRCATSEMGRVFDAKDLVKKYVEHLRASIDFDLSGLKIAIDCSNGSAAMTAKDIFSGCGAECHFIACEPDGTNINNSCGSTHIESIAEYVRNNSMDVGIAYDGDADRCLATDELGNEIDGDFIMAILSLALKAEGKLNKNTVVGTIMTNYGFTKFCEENDISFTATKVGDRYVLESMELSGFSFGGEQSGHIILRDFATTGDGQMTSLHLLSHIKKSGKKLSELSSVMKKYPQHMVNLTANPTQKNVFFTNEEIQGIIESATEELSGNGRIVARPSGTEPVIRIMVEGIDEEKTVSICESVAAKIQAILDKN